MEQKKKKRKYHLYIPWFTNDAEFYDEEEEDSWVSYIRRNLEHPAGEESPFPDSSWGYTRSDSPFDENDDDAKSETKSDVTIHDEVTDGLYQHPDIDASNINSIVLNGIVCLFGSVGSLLEKNEAERLVKNLPGVWTVRNELKIVDSKRRSLYGTQDYLE